MLANLGHIKFLVFLAAMLGAVSNHVMPHDHYDEEPHFDDDPVPGDSFPHHIFNKS